MRFGSIAALPRFRRPVISREALFLGSITLVFVLLSVVAGLVASTGLNVLTLGLSMVLVAACLATAPVRLMLPTLLFVACVVIGLLEYFARIKQGLWIPYGLAMLMLLRLPDTYARSTNYRNAAASTPLAGWILAFIASVFVSIAVNTPPPMQAVAGGKNYLLLWIIFFVIAWGALPTSSVERAFRWTLWLALLQFPFVLYQYFFIALERSTRGGRYGVAWDAVVGTFGGDPMGGGSSGTMAFFLVTALIYAIALQRQRLAGWGTVIAIFTVVAATTALAEIKIVILLLPLGLLVIMGSDIKKRPLIFFGVSAVTITSLLALLLLYNEIHYGGRAGNFTELMDEVFGYSLDINHLNYETGELGRAAAFSVWISEGFKGDLVGSIFGYSPGATRTDSLFAVGELAAKYPYRLERSAAVQMLWEIGVVGFLLYFCILCRGIQLCGKLLKSKALSRERHPIVLTCMTVFVLSFVMWPYGRELLEVPAQSILLVVCLGYVSLITSEMRHKARIEESERCAS